LSILHQRSKHSPCLTRRNLRRNALLCRSEAGGHKFVAGEAFLAALLQAGNFQPLRLDARPILLAKLLLLALKVPPALDTIQRLQLARGDNPATLGAVQRISRKGLRRNSYHCGSQHNHRHQDRFDGPNRQPHPLFLVRGETRFA
jgi:hypothetical protein